MAAALSGVSAFAQGFFTFTSGGGLIWDASSGVSSVKDNAVDWAVLINLGTAGNAAVNGINPLGGTQNGVGANPTNNFAGFSGNPWTAILGDTAYSFATNSNVGQLIQGTTTAAGGMGGLTTLISNQPVLGTSSAGGTINVVIVAWLASGGSTPWAAAAANAAVGWSKPFAYVYQSSSTAPTAWGTQVGGSGGTYPFGISPVPEPASFALAGLGAAAMLIFRRRK